MMTFHQFDSCCNLASSFLASFFFSCCLLCAAELRKRAAVRDGGVAAPRRAAAGPPVAAGAAAAVDHGDAHVSGGAALDHALCMLASDCAALAAAMSNGCAHE